MNKNLNFLTVMGTLLLTASLCEGRVQALAMTAPRPAPLATPAPPPAPLTMNSVLKEILSSNQPFWPLENGDLIELDLVKKLYSLRGFQPAFVGPAGPTSSAQALRNVILLQSELKGLWAADYWSMPIIHRWNLKSPRDLAELDLLLVQSYINFASDLSIGRVDPRTVESNINTTTLGRKPFAEFATLNSLIGSNQFQAGMEQLEPSHFQYKKLEAQLAQFIALRDQTPGWPVIKLATTLRLNGNSPVVPLVRTRMIQLGLMTSGPTDSSSIYDADLQNAVKLFQTLVRVPMITGVLDKATLSQMNISLDRRIAQIKANMERWRWMPKDLGPRYIFVNTATQKLNVVENNASVMQMDLITGELLRPTPLFIDQMSDVILNPYWHPPASLMRIEVIANQIKDPTWINTHHFQVFQNTTQVDPASIPWDQYSQDIPPGVSFREDVGPGNSLGIVKFNLFKEGQGNDVYLHDTNERFLFKRNLRYNSNGCIRVGNPLGLLTYVLRDQPAWPADKLKYLTSHSKDNPAIDIPLKSMIPVYATYFSAGFDNDGHYFMTPDFYQIDARTLKSMLPQARPL
jgi:murein L,D-transpeptidase YcbB/YkuD